MRSRIARARFNGTSNRIDPFTNLAFHFIPVTIDMKKSRLFAAFAVGACIAIAIIAFRQSSGQDLPAITVYKSPTCGCCTNWVDHLEDNGFKVKSVDTRETAKMKLRYGVPGDLRSCHTALVSGYVVEGHVPAEEIKTLLSEEPDVTGLAVPGMPVGSPGMEQGDRVDPYDIIAFHKNGKRTVFASKE